MKHYLNKLIKTLTAVSLFTVFFAFAAYAEEGLIYFSDPAVNSGETVEVTMTVQSDNTRIGDVNVLLKYPSPHISYCESDSVHKRFAV